MKRFETAQLVARVKNEDEGLFRELEALWHSIEPSCEYVKTIFPEYTPHDATHLSRLFELSENILGAEIIGSLNVTECFLLAAGIIAHDWGMGVSAKEQQAIIGGKQGIVELTGPDGIVFRQPLLPNEQRRLREHCLGRGIDFVWNETARFVADPKQDHWRDYLRDTHPERSAERIQQHFSPREYALGRAVALIAQGHGREPKVIEDTQQYQLGEPLAGETVNLQALTLYLRLIDLLDVGRGRTPYELWRFVNPGNQTSAAEWKKHHSMEDPTFEGDFIRMSAHPVAGNILAEVFNLRGACEGELEWQWRLLKHLSLPHYYYPRSRMSWQITPVGDLHPTPVRFEFARDELLHLLSEEIYEGDPYVFLRELLQNGIDAIRTRRERRRASETPLDRRKSAIIIESGEDKEGNVTITVRDVGTGMTAYVISNYLAVAGRSYYQSSDFRRLGLSFDPISRFGIGILSCFVVAERVIIRTRTDPDCFTTASPTVSEAWEIEIPSGRGGLPLGYWEWRSLDPSTLSIGTEVTVVLNSKKFHSQVQKLQPQHRLDALDITKYLKAIASFVEFPVYIREGELRTVILHPNSNVQDAIDPDRAEYSIHQQQLNYDLAVHVSPLDLERARENVEIVSVELTDLKIPGIEGILSYPRPKSPWKVINRSGREFTLMDDSGNSLKIEGPKWSQGDEGYMESFRAEGMCKSARRFKRGGVYFQGILLPDTVTPKAVGFHGSYTSTLLAFPNLFVDNVKIITDEHRPGPSRGSLRDSREDWPNAIFAAHSRLIGFKARERLIEMAPFERFAALVRILEQDFVKMEDFATEFAWDEWPVPILLEGGTVEIRLLRDLGSLTEVIEAPRLIAQMASMQLLKQMHYPCVDIPSLKNWRYPFCVFGFYAQTQSIRSFTSTVLKQRFHQHHHVLALSSPRLNGEQHQSLPPFYVDRWENKPVSMFRVSSLNEYLTILQTGVGDPDLLSGPELREIGSGVPATWKFERYQGEMPVAFSSYCLWDAETINAQHPIGKALCRVFCAYASARLRNILAPIDQARFEQMLGLPIRTFSQSQEGILLNSLNRVNERLAEIGVAVQSCASLGLPYLPPLELTRADFLPGAFNFADTDEFVCFSLEGDLFGSRLFVDNVTDEDFGRALNRDSPWPPV